MYLKQISGIAFRTFLKRSMVSAWQRVIKGCRGYTGTPCRVTRRDNDYIRYYTIGNLTCKLLKPIQNHKNVRNIYKIVTYTKEYIKW